MGRHRPTKVGVYLRVLGRDGLRLGLLGLNGWAATYLRRRTGGGAGDAASRRRFLEKNAVLQKELDGFFAPYRHFCPACDSCCLHVHIPYGALDRVVYGLPPAPGRPAETMPFAAFLGELGYLVRRYLARPFRWIGAAQPREGPAQPAREERASECLGPEGCRVPLGMRPALCMLFACTQFLENMDRAAYRRYLRLGCAYLKHLTVGLAAAAAAGRQEGGGDPAGDRHISPG